MHQRRRGGQSNVYYQVLVTSTLLDPNKTFITVTVCEALRCGVCYRASERRRGGHGGAVPRTKNSIKSVSINMECEGVFKYFGAGLWNPWGS